MNPQVGSAKDLIKRTEDLSELFLIRAINDSELEELLENGPENFCFHAGTLYEKVWGNMTAKHGQLRSGTIIVYAPNENDLNSEAKKFELGEAFITCKVDFFGPVEIYNIDGLDWDGIIEYARKYGPTRDRTADRSV